MDPNKMKSLGCSQVPTASSVQANIRWKILKRKRVDQAIAFSNPTSSNCTATDLTAKASRQGIQIKVNVKSRGDVNNEAELAVDCSTHRDGVDQIQCRPDVADMPVNICVRDCISGAAIIPSTTVTINARQCTPARSPVGQITVTVDCEIEVDDPPAAIIGPDCCAPSKTTSSADEAVNNGHCGHRPERTWMSNDSSGADTVQFLPHQKASHTESGYPIPSATSIQESKLEPSQVSATAYAAEQCTDDSSHVSSKASVKTSGPNPLISELYSSDSEDESASEDEDSAKKAEVYDNLFKVVKVSNEVTAGSLLRLVLRFTLQNSTSFSGTVNLARMLNVAFGSRLLPDTRYLFDKLCNNHIIHTLHAVCPECSGYGATFEESAPRICCKECDFEFDACNRSDTCYFVIIHPSDAIRDYLELYEDYYDYVVNHRQSDPNRMSDIQDGQVYIDVVKSLLKSAGYSYVTAGLNLDGVTISERSNLSVTPIYLSINEIPPQTRLDNPIVAGMWAGAKQPEMHVFLDIFVESMNCITNSGIDCTIKGQKLNIKLHIILSPVDTMARFKMNMTKMFMNAFGCDWCLIKGIWYERSMRYRHLPTPAPPRTLSNHIYLAKVALQKGLDHCFGVTPKVSPLINLTSFRIIDSFVPEPMHQTSAGCADQITECVMKTLKPADLALINQYLEEPRVPTQFGRLGRTLTLRHQFKCREWENWLIHFSVPILSKVVQNKKILAHWGLLVDAPHLSQKSCNYYAQLKCGSFIKILRFFVDLRETEENTLCQFINVRSNRYARTVKEVTSIDENEESIPTDVIDKICVYMKIGLDEYIIPAPNMLHY
ncbi:hypothetical protein QAD02_012147 [Eretmocerus hayati]|uniref:Uncharacterized protein n=1 Tax=Eretmocerus hayati TaxID=131215 RepID=A0ACC2NYJ6_9HYME|nr:hypothetical protein QAD02_012147 [Eretmocerus hayati]